MGKYNLLTRELMAAGYDAFNHPNYVKVAGGCFNKADPLDNLYGGFEFIRAYADKFTYKTGCGLFVQGIHVLDDLSCYGETHSHENNNPVVSCPYLKKGCKENFNFLIGNEICGGGLCAQCWCECHRTDESFDYNKSIERANKQNREKREMLFQELVKKYNGRICKNHCYFNEHKQEWFFDYNPKHCAVSCPKMYTYCDVLGKQLSKKKGNVFFDVKKEYDVQVGDGQQIGLFDKSHITEITKGFKVFKKPISLDICQAYAKVGLKDIQWNYEVNHSSEKFWNNTVSFEVINIRAEVKETRDLFQDLEDIKNGITISHESDNLAEKKDLKRERSEKAKEAKRRKFIREIQNKGWDYFDVFEKNKILKVLDEEEIEEANKEFLKPKQEPRQEDKQMSIFDLIGGLP